jgi:hypothetical protein
MCKKNHILIIRTLTYFFFENTITHYKCFFSQNELSFVLFFLFGCFVITVF